MPDNITEEFVHQLTAQIDFLTKQNAKLTTTIDSMNQTINEIRAQTNKNSKNSSKPSSSDGFKKPPIKKERSLRKKPGKKQGCFCSDRFYLPEYVPDNSLLFQSTV